MVANRVAQTPAHVHTHGLSHCLVHIACYAHLAVLIKSSMQDYGVTALTSGREA